MQAAQILIPHDIQPAYNAHNVFDHSSASRRILLKTNDIQPVPPPPQPRMPQNPPPPNNGSPPKQEQKVIKAVGVPAMTPDGVVMVDDPESRSTRSYTPVKLVGDGSFGTVWLCDWHGSLPANTPLSPMQCGAGARPDWAGKRLVALKRMKKRWEGGWEECKRLKELESLRIIPRHANIIPLYDFFVMPSTKELYFVFECMEGNLYQLIRSRKGRPLAGGLVSSIFRQVCNGLYHIHQSGYFHRDMKPENLLVTTTGLHDYLTTNRRVIAANSNAPLPTERDVAVIVKLADFGLARETASKPPYTEYVSTRWYRAPEVLLRSRDYSNPVDMWALGTIMAELVNLAPLFPGQSETDQVALICEVLGDPSDDYGVDERGVSIGGGPWFKGIRMASSLGYAFGKMPPKPFHTLFEPTVPLSLIECISDLLKYDPNKRLTSYDCVNHPYLCETAQKQPPPPPFVPLPPPLQSQRSKLHVDPLPPSTNGTTSLTSSSSSTSLPSIPPRNIPHSHSFPSLHQIRSPQQHYADAASPVSTTPHSPSPLSPMVALPPSTTMTSGIVDQMRDLDLPDEYGKRHRRHPQEDGNVPTMDVDPEQHTNTSQRISQEQQQQQASGSHSTQSSQASSSHKGGLFTFGKKKKTLGIFGGNSDKSVALPPVEEIDTSAGNSVSLKRTQSGSTGSQSFDDKLHPNGAAGSVPHLTVSNTNGQTAAAEPTPAEAKKTKKEILMEQRQHARERQKAMSRRVLQNRDVMHSNSNIELEYISSTTQAVVGSATGAAAPTGLGAPRRPSISNPRRVAHSIGPTSVDTRMDVRMVPPVIREEPSDHHQMLLNRSAKARRRDTDDDHSQSSVSISLRSRRQSVGTMDSDPGPSRSPPPVRGLRERPSEYNIQRAASRTSLRSGLSTGNSSLRGYSSSARSSTSLELGVVTGFADMSVLGVRGIASPSEIIPSNLHSQHFSHPHSHSPLGQAGLGGSSPSDLSNSVPLLRGQHGNSQYITLPPLPTVSPAGSGPPYPLSDKGSHETLHLKREVGMDPGRPPGSPMNPMFHVPLQDSSQEDTHMNNLLVERPSLPPFSHIASMADQGADMSDSPLG